MSSAAGPCSAVSPARPWAGEDLAQVRGCCGSGTHKPHAQQRGRQQSSWPARQRLWRQRSSSPSLVCPSIFSKCKLPLAMWLVFSSHKGWSRGGTLLWEHFCSCQPGSLCVGTTHTGTSPLDKGVAVPVQPPQATSQERGDVGLQTKPGSCCGSGISGEGMISTTINTSDYLIRGMRRSPGGGLHTQKRRNSCPH